MAGRLEITGSIPWGWGGAAAGRFFIAFASLISSRSSQASTISHGRAPWVPDPSSGWWTHQIPRVMQGEVGGMIHMPISHNNSMILLVDMHSCLIDDFQVVLNRFRYVFLQWKFAIILNWHWFRSTILDRSTEMWHEIAWKIPGSVDRFWPGRPKFPDLVNCFCPVN